MIRLCDFFFFIPSRFERAHLKNVPGFLTLKIEEGKVVRGRVSVETRPPLSACNVDKRSRCSAHHHPSRSQRPRETLRKMSEPLASSRCHTITPSRCYAGRSSAQTAIFVPGTTRSFFTGSPMMKWVSTGVLLAIDRESNAGRQYRLVIHPPDSKRQRSGWQRPRASSSRIET